MKLNLIHIIRRVIMKKNKLIPLILFLVIICCSCSKPIEKPEYLVRFYEVIYYDNSSSPVITRIGAMQIPEGGVIGDVTYDDRYIEHCYFKGWYTDESFTESWDLHADKVYSDVSIYARYESDETKVSPSVSATFSPLTATAKPTAQATPKHTAKPIAQATPKHTATVDQKNELHEIRMQAYRDLDKFVNENMPEYDKTAFIGIDSELTYETIQNIRQNISSLESDGLSLILEAQSKGTIELVYNYHTMRIKQELIMLDGICRQQKILNDFKAKQDELLESYNKIEKEYSDRYYGTLDNYNAEKATLNSALQKIYIAAEKEAKILRDFHGYSAEAAHKQAYSQASAEAQPYHYKLEQLEQAWNKTLEYEKAIASIVAEQNELLENNDIESQIESISEECDMQIAALDDKLQKLFKDYNIQEG